MLGAGGLCVRGFRGLSSFDALICLPEMEGRTGFDGRAGASLGQAGWLDQDGDAASRSAVGGAAKGLVVMVLDKTFSTLRRRLSACVNSFRDDESGATSIEYGLIVSLIFLAIIASVRAFTNTTSEMYGTIDEAMQNN